MKQVLIAVPALFLLALIVSAFLLYRQTDSQTACKGDDCDSLTAEELADLVIEARTQ